MKPAGALATAVVLTLWGVAVVVGYFAAGIIFVLAWPYWAFAWMAALILLLLPQLVYSSFIREEYRRPSRTLRPGAMRAARGDKL